jgi:hypothetical protein
MATIKGYRGGWKIDRSKFGNNEMLHVKTGHYAQDCTERNQVPIPYQDLFISNVDILEEPRNGL